MVGTKLNETALQLERDIAKANAAGRLELQPELAKVLEQMDAEGQEVPRRLRELDALLVSEAIEAQFDNMPL